LEKEKKESRLAIIVKGGEEGDGHHTPSRYNGVFHQERKEAGLSFAISGGGWGKKKKPRFSAFAGRNLLNFQEKECSNLTKKKKTCIKKRGRLVHFLLEEKKRKVKATPR